MHPEPNHLSDLNLAFTCEFEPEYITEAEQMRYEDMQNEADYERQSYGDDRFDNDNQDARRDQDEFG